VPERFGDARSPRAVVFHLKKGDAPLCRVIQQGIAGTWLSILEIASVDGDSYAARIYDQPAVLKPNSSGNVTVTAKNQRGRTISPRDP
jgi:hypothetical protein